MANDFWECGGVDVELEDIGPEACWLPSQSWPGYASAFVWIDYMVTIMEWVS